MNYSVLTGDLCLMWLFYPGLLMANNTSSRVTLFTLISS